MDTLSTEARSERMSRVQCKDTRPELAVRRLVHSLGFRYALHRRDLPGKPDLVFPSRRKVVFVHGCFWHRHCGRCRLARLPKSRLDFWSAKLEANRRRDRRNAKALRDAGWQVMCVWECQLADKERLTRRIINFLELNG
jgi:DNA mismatch endonuclease (patch repair protein)